MKLFRGLSGKVSGGDIHMLVYIVVASVGLGCVCSCEKQIGSVYNAQDKLYIGAYSPSWGVVAWIVLRYTEMSCEIGHKRMLVMFVTLGWSGSSQAEKISRHYRSQRVGETSVNQVYTAYSNRHDSMLA